MFWRENEAQPLAGNITITVLSAYLYSYSILRRRIWTMIRYRGSSTSRRRGVCTSVWSLCVLAVVVLSKVDEEEEHAHPDPNDENHPGMIYIGRLEGEKDEDRRRVGFDLDNGE